MAMVMREPIAVANVDEEEESPTQRPKLNSSA